MHVPSRVSGKRWNSSSTHTFSAEGISSAQWNVNVEKELFVWKSAYNFESDYCSKFLKSPDHLPYYNLNPCFGWSLHSLYVKRKENKNIFSYIWRFPWSHSVCAEVIDVMYWFVATTQGMISMFSNVIFQTCSLMKAESHTKNNIYHKYIEKIMMCTFIYTM